MRGRPWSVEEIEVVVADYFAMLEAELSGRPYNKSAHRRRLRQQVDRSDRSIESKHQNITAILIGRDEPTIAGYKPLPHYQASLEVGVLQWLDLYPDFFEQFEGGPVLSPRVKPALPARARLSTLVESAPRLSQHVRSERPWGARSRKVDYVRRDAENRRLGRMGEEWVVEFERRRLRDEEQRADLARKVEWVADTKGDGLGYDVASYNADASSRLIEVKTTGLGKYFPFVVTANEVRVSRREATAYWLYRVFEFSSRARLYRLQGPLLESWLTPTQYRANLTSR